MASNYPPGVTGNEPQIAGYDEVDTVVEDFECRHCGAAADGPVDGVQLRATAYTYVVIVDCPACGRTNETEHDAEDPRDPDEKHDEKDWWE